MSAEDIAEEIRNALPGTEEIIVQYLSGYLVDDAAEDEDVLVIAQDILQSVAGDKQKQVQELMDKLNALLEEQLATRQRRKAQPKLQKLDKVLDMGKSQVSNTLLLSEGVDLESINKGKASRVDVKKLEKQEAKLRVRSTQSLHLRHLADLT
ncbi:hypothetical protein NMY22_g10224 [Coprinellus aureogranulatus]|nr:hypothetical protein NMY22_g10224 [Coprinellus aureogranulatus]